jgi:hypothetical protein
MEAAGRDFSGKVGFVETEMRFPVNHMVAQAEDALSCVSCHSRNGRMEKVPGIFMPGRGASSVVDTLGILLIAGSLLGVLGHGALRALMKRRNSGKASS